MRNIIFIMIVLFTGCKAHKAVVTNTHTHSDSTIYRDRIVDVRVKGDSVRQIVNRSLYDSLMNVLSKQKVGTTIVYRNDSKSQTELVYYRDQMNNLIAECRTKDSTHQITVQDKERIIRDSLQSISKEAKDNKSLLQQIKDTIFWIIIGAVIMFVGMFIFAMRK